MISIQTIILYKILTGYCPLLDRKPLPVFETPYALIHQHPPYYQERQMGNYPDHEVELVKETHRAIVLDITCWSFHIQGSLSLSSYLVTHNSCCCSHHIQGHSNRLHGKRQHPRIGIVLGLQYPKSNHIGSNTVHVFQ